MLDLAKEKNLQANASHSGTKRRRGLNALAQQNDHAQQNESTKDGQLAIKDVQLDAAEEVQLDAAELVQLGAAEEVQLGTAEEVQLGAAEEDVFVEEDTPVIHLMNSPFSNGAIGVDDIIKQELLEYQKTPRAGEFR
jgi:hypothetical protein